MQPTQTLTITRKRLSALVAGIAVALGAPAVAQNTMNRDVTPPAARPDAPPSTMPAPGTMPMPSTTAPGTMTAPAAGRADDDWKMTKDQLEKTLSAVTSRAGYAQALESAGYRVSAINADRPTYLEYEVVKGKDSYEIQLDFDKDAAKAKEIDVTTNMWRADSTKRMLTDANYRPGTAMKADPEGRYSDRRYMEGWSSEKKRLEAALKPGRDLTAYRSSLEKMGYTISSVNDRETDYVEYEIVKGQNSYEVQIDLDKGTQRGAKIDVTENVYDAPGTDRVKATN